MHLYVSIFTVKLNFRKVEKEHLRKVKVEHMYATQEQFFVIQIRSYLHIHKLYTIYIFVVHPL